MFPMIIIWNDNTEIWGHKCASVTIDDKRLYVAGTVPAGSEAWIDTVKIGNYADFAEAKAAVLVTNSAPHINGNLRRQVSKRSSTR